MDLPNRPTAEDVEDDEAKAMSRDELAEMLAMVPEQWHLFFWFLAATGVSISEAIALQWRHLALDAPVPHVMVRRALVKGRMGPPKSATAGARFHSIRCSLQRSTSTTRLRSRPVTRTPYSQPPTDRRSCQTTSSGECSSPLGRPQTFRGSAFTLSVIPAHRSCSLKAANAVQVQRWLGHHSAAFTLATYVHLLDGDLGEPLAILQEGGHDAELAG